MSTVFTNFVRSFADTNQITAEVIASVRQHLAAVLRKRGLYQASPSLLGYSGSRWDDDDSFNDLAFDCLEWALLGKLDKLLEYLKCTDSIDAVVVRNIKNFVWEKQRQQDPNGHSVYQNLKATVASLAEAGALHRVNEGENSGLNDSADTEFRFGGASTCAAADEHQIKEALLRSGLMFDGLQAFASVGSRAQEILEATVIGLKGSDVGAFSLGGLKKAICLLIAESNAARVAPGRRIVRELFEEFSENSRTDLPDGSYEQSETREDLNMKIHAEIDCSRKSQSVKRRLHQILDLATEAEAGKTPPGSFTVEELQATLEVERTTVYDDLKFLALLRERVVSEQINKVR